MYIYIYYIPLPSSDAHPSKKLLLFNISKCGTIQAAVKTVDGQILGKVSMVCVKIIGNSTSI